MILMIDIDNMAMDLEGVPASLSPGDLDKLAELVFTKLAQQKLGYLPSKQVVAGSSPVSRSTDTKS